VDALTLFGAWNVTEGNAIAILTPAELPPGNISWTAREVHAADQAFATPATFLPADTSVVNTWLLTSAAMLAWKEATFMSSSQEEDRDEKDDENQSTRS